MADNDFIAVPTNNSGGGLANLDADSLRKLWRKKVSVHEQENDFYQQFEGSREDSIIETVTDTSVGAGHEITFTSMAGFHQRGRSGDQTFDTPDDYEQVRIKSNKLKVDYWRNGVRWNERMEEHMGLRHELAIKFPDELGKWMGRKKCRATEMKWIRTALSTGYNFACAASSIDALSGTNTLGWSEIVEVGAILKGHGAPPAYAGKVGRNPVHRYLLVGSHIGLSSLKRDEDYLAALHEASVDGTANVLFTGGFADVDGNIIIERQIIDHDGDGPMGGPIAPKIRLGAQVTAGTGAFTISGGSNSKVLYTQDFPNHQFEYNASDIEGATSDEFYLLVVNPANALVDPGKMGFYKCVGNDGNTITVTERLGETGGGIRHPQVGSVQWNTGVWAGKHTDVHPAGAMAYLANAKGQPYGYSIILGACGMRRGYGSHRNARATDQKEGGFIQESYVVSVFGMGPKINARGEHPNFMVLAHSLHIPGSPIPTNIT